MTSKITNQLVLDCIADMQKKNKERKVQQTVELQVSLKDYDPQKDKRFAGTVKLAHVPRPNLKICMIVDQKHLDEATALGIGKDGNRHKNVEVTTLDNLKKFNKDKKLIKKWAKKYYLLLATDALVKKITNLNVAVGNQEMTDEELRQNIVMSLNFLASLLKKGWHNLKAVHIKTTMGGSIKLL